MINAVSYLALGAMSVVTALPALQRVEAVLVQLRHVGAALAGGF